MYLYPKTGVKAQPFCFGGSQNAGFQQGGFGGCSWTPKTGTRVQKAERWYQKTGTVEGTENGTAVPKTGTRAHSPKPPFYKTALFLASLNGALANGGLRYLSTIVHDCLQLSSFASAQKATNVHKCRRLCTNP